MKVVFLDFDGVLNGDAHFASPAFLRATAGMSDAELMLVSRVHHLDPEKVRLVDGLVARTGATVVLSTSWRLGHSLGELNGFLRDRGARFVAEAVTPRVTEHDPSRPLRAREILAYLSALPEPPVAQVVLDDDDVGSFVGGHVRTNPGTGIVPGDVERAVALLLGHAA